MVCLCSRQTFSRSGDAQPIATIVVFPEQLKKYLSLSANLSGSFRWWQEAGIILFSPIYGLEDMTQSCDEILNMTLTLTTFLRRVPGRCIAFLFRKGIHFIATSRLIENRNTYKEKIRSAILYYQVLRRSAAVYDAAVFALKATSVFFK